MTTDKISIKLIGPLQHAGDVKPRVWGFYRVAHHKHAMSGVSFAGIVALPGDRVLLLAGPSKDGLLDFITQHCTDALSHEVLRLENLQ